MAKIAWFVARLIEGSGGHRTIFQHAYALKLAGHENHIYVDGSERTSIEKLFGYHFEYVYSGWSNPKPVDLAIATVWYSAVFVKDLPFSCKKAYFVQDYEAMFYSIGAAYIMAENSYTYGLIPITIGRWLKNKLQKDFNIPAYHFDFGSDTKIYRPLDLKREMAICFIYQPDKPRRCSRLGILALKIVKYHRPDVKIYLYGSPVNEKENIRFEHEHLGLLTPKECNVLYNRCMLGLCLSASNPSRIPFEMMAAGLPVVELWRENNLYDFPSSAVSLSSQDTESLAENMLRLLSDEERCKQMSQAGTVYMSKQDIQVETRQFCNNVEQILNGGTVPMLSCEKMYTFPPFAAQKNGRNILSQINHEIYIAPGAALNKLPQFIQRILRWGARKARRLLSYY